MTLKLWLQFIFNRKQYIKDLDRFDVSIKTISTGSC